MIRFLYTSALVSAVAFSLSGCASYYTHYAMFPAENSAGEQRKVRLHWQSAEYPAWWPVSNKATTIKLETQCSDRVWRISDSTHDSFGNCASGPAACGGTGLDVAADSGREATERDACLVIPAAGAGNRVADLGGQFDLLVSCRPARAEISQGGETVNMDYLRASPVAYTVYARKVPRGSLAARLPEFEQAPCRD
ncbi:hypothetical protein C7H09_14015 [Marinobacter fuscus]|uniref:Uncharacterized protein n=1 Tax=Marinobacter fuscus TaxID=2109942 RepID=A0A2T1K7N1_9GAMM|nr:hypothetical protein [Marinobacter fuscus]PSF05763.1 hypothetical protein C7H09_14015 [Marinobacter fuscus]